MIDYEKITELIAASERYTYIMEGYGLDPQGHMMELPMWLHDLSAAIKLLDAIGGDWTISRTDDEYICQLLATAKGVITSRACTTVAYAVCDAYLTYFEINENWSK